MKKLMTSLYLLSILQAHAAWTPLWRSPEGAGPVVKGQANDMAGATLSNVAGITNTNGEPMGIPAGYADVASAALNSLQLVPGPVCSVTTSNGTTALYYTLQAGCGAMGDNSTLNMLRSPPTMATNCFIQGNNIVFNGNNVPVKWERNGIAAQVAVNNEPKSCFVAYGTNMVFNNLRFYGVDGESYPSDTHHFYVFTLDARGVKDVYFNECHLMGGFVADRFGTTAPKVLVATHHTNVIYRGGSVGYYCDTEDRTQARKIIDFHEDYSSFRFVGTKFFASDPDLWKAGDPPFNNAGNASATNMFTDCYYNGMVMSASSVEIGYYGSMFPSKPLTLEDLRSVAFPGTENLFTEDDITTEGMVTESVQGYSGSFFGYLEKPRLVSGGDKQYGIPYLSDCWEVERYDYTPTSSTIPLHTYSKAVVMSGHASQTVKGNLLVPFAKTPNTSGGQPGYWGYGSLPANERITIRCFGEAMYYPEDTAWMLRIQNGDLDILQGSADGLAYPTDPEYRLAITLNTNLTVSAGDRFTIPGNVTGLLDRDQTSTNVLYVRAIADITYGFPVSGADITVDGTTYTGAFQGINIDTTSSYRGFYISDQGLCYIGRTDGPAVYEVWLKQDVHE